ncbi:MAG: chlorite dismutase family protein [Gemmatimonadetes bacterium]|nr:chlorite dismutase family protein [Gemmatimonadota bacterium]
MAERRQCVRFTFYQVAPGWRGLPPEEREAGKREVAAAVHEFTERMVLLRTYSLVGLRHDADLMFWQVSERLDDFSDFAARIASTPLGPYLTTPYGYLAMTRRSMYVKGHVHEGQEGARLQVRPGKGTYLFVYPFVKTRDWYLLPMAERQRMMDEHFAVGHRYPRVKINTTYSFGLDDQEFVVAFETDYPEDFLELVMELREIAASRYTLRDTPIFSCVRTPVEEALDRLGGVESRAEMRG